MKNYNVRIQSVITKKHEVCIIIEGGTHLKFKNNKMGKWKVSRLMHYAGAIKISEMEGKILKEFDTDNNLIIALGDANKDRCIPLFGNFQYEITKTSLKNMLNKCTENEIVEFQDSVYGDD